MHWGTIQADLVSGKGVFAGYACWACETPAQGNTGGGMRHLGTARPRPSKAIQRQQLGRAMDRNRAGGTGRAGRSNAGTRLADVFIGGLLVYSNSQCLASGSELMVPVLTGEPGEFVLSYTMTFMFVKENRSIVR
jgi:hypothetical protein